MKLTDENMEEVAGIGYPEGACLGMISSGPDIVWETIFHTQGEIMAGSPYAGKFDQKSSSVNPAAPNFVQMCARQILVEAIEGNLW